ncbi:hypothetical protein [Amycolatopsis sp. cmx-11-12]|uniref:hypothetical protein n=1 Tax=Amycolatopsis sp. cmx-11-12 TaxID=2785795 RepID=UPI003917E4EB
MASTSLRNSGEASPTGASPLSTAPGSGSKRTRCGLPGTNELLRTGMAAAVT